MDKLIVVVFRDEKSAYEGVSALHTLDDEVSIVLNRLAVIKKNADGTVVTERVDDDFPPPSGTLAGTAIGSLIGILGGPIGFAVGAGVGGLVGVIRDLRTAQVDADFLADVTSALTPGHYAVLADVEEERITPLEKRMEDLGGVVFRTLKVDVEDTRREREAAARKAELEELKAEHAKAKSDRKAKLQARIDQLRARMEKHLEQDRSRSEQAAKETQARVQALQKKADNAKGDARSAMEARISRLREEYQHHQHA
ncbi:MAG TPA: DUF1269 domain-containing protein [Steroidobacteraceae bacterium]|nr:DUF1269 domain-containing protein [Steroidobacteraceae bacterium]